MRKIDLLRQLQEIDTQADAARLAVSQLTEQIGNRGALPEREAEVAAARAELHPLETQQKDLELQADQRRAKIDADEGKLYSGRVTNPKELTSLTEEVAQDRRQLGMVEDRLLEVLVRNDEATARLQGLEANLSRETQAWETDQQQARTRLHEAQNSLTQLDTRRVSLLNEVDAPARSAYESLRRQKGGMAVAPVVQRTCQACRVSLTPAQEQRARIGADLVACHSCGRLLYVPLA